jgi:hypothetical protein
MAKKIELKPLEPVAHADDRTPKAAEMAKRRRGPSRSDARRREEFHRADDANKGHTKTPI